MIDKVAIFFSISLIFVVGTMLVFIFSQKRTLKKEQKQMFLRKIEQLLRSKKSPREKLIDMDIQMHQILKALGYKWSFWEILKKNGKNILDRETLWKLHKARNTLVHEVDSINESEIEKILKKYERYIVSFLK